MKLETFFEKFDQFADAPGAVAKMRELVRDLAVRGRLFGKAVENEANGLPNGWHQLQLGEVAQFINGDRSKNYPSKSFRVDDGVPFINAGHLFPSHPSPSRSGSWRRWMS
jgi:restriction endonuclease S subunit